MVNSRAFVGNSTERSALGRQWGASIVPNDSFTERRLSVLVVEDEAAVCALLAEALGAEGLEVVCAGDDQAAYGLLGREGSAYDALILDINLGQGTTGFDVARFARKLNPDVPVIYISGGAETSVEKHGVPGSALVAKPFDLPLLLSTLREKLPR